MIHGVVGEMILYPWEVRGRRKGDEKRVETRQRETSSSSTFRDFGFGFR